jgi:AraC-like DNA-binding protein
LADSANGDGRAAAAKAQVDIWSTDAARARERFSYWRDAVCRSVFNISIEAAPERFAARIRARSAGPLRFALSESSGYRIVRNRSDIDSAPADHYSVYLQLRGQTAISQRDASFVFHANDIAISDGHYPFNATLADGSRAIAVIPHALIDRRAPWLRQTPLHRLAANSRYVDLARGHLLELTDTSTELTDSAANLLTENLYNLLALASAAEAPHDRLQPELQIEAILAFCGQNLHDSALSPQLVADHFRISVRTLHLRFRQIGQTFGRWVLDNRLDMCRTALRDRGQREASISSVAYGWGFNDLSHFNKSFRARFGETPRDWRNGSGG